MTWRLSWSAWEWWMRSTRREPISPACPRTTIWCCLRWCISPLLKWTRRGRRPLQPPVPSWWCAAWCVQSAFTPITRSSSSYATTPPRAFCSTVASALLELPALHHTAAQVSDGFEPFRSHNTSRWGSGFRPVCFTAFIPECLCCVLYWIIWSQIQSVYAFTVQVHAALWINLQLFKNKMKRVQLEPLFYCNRCCRFALKVFFSSISIKRIWFRDSLSSESWNKHK